MRVLCIVRAASCRIAGDLTPFLQSCVLWWVSVIGGSRIQINCVRNQGAPRLYTFATASSTCVGVIHDER